MPDNKSMWLNIYTQIEQAIFFGETLNSRQLFCAANPGQFLDPSLDEANDDDLSDQSEILNSLLDASCVYSPLIGSVPEKYWDMVDFALLPQKSLSKEEIKEIEDIGKWLTRQEKDYTFYKEAYYDAADFYERVIRDPNSTSSQKNRAMERKNTALSNWKNPKKGAADEWDRKNGRLNFLNSRDPNVAWDELRTAKQNPVFRRINSKGEVFYPAYLYPTISEVEVTDRWTQLSIHATDSASSHHSSATSWSGGVGISWGLWSLGGSGGGHSVDTHDSTEASTVDIECEALRARIRRPWLKPSVFGMRSWRWDTKVHGDEKLSDGGNMSLSPPTRPVGTMPLLTTEVLIVRNVRISGGWGSTDTRYHERVNGGSASVGYGPFRINGSYEHRDVSKEVRSHAENGTISIPHPQIIGYFSTVMPESPNPDEGLSWPDKARLLGAGYGQEYYDKRREVRAEEAALYFADERYWRNLSAIQESVEKSYDELRTLAETEARLAFETSKRRVHEPTPLFDVTAESTGQHSNEGKKVRNKT